MIPLDCPPHQVLLQCLRWAGKDAFDTAAYIYWNFLQSFKRRTSQCTALAKLTTRTLAFTFTVLALAVLAVLALAVLAVLALAVLALATLATFALAAFAFAAITTAARAFDALALAARALAARAFDLHAFMLARAFGLAAFMFARTDLAAPTLATFSDFTFAILATFAFAVLALALATLALALAALALAARAARALAVLAFAARAFAAIAPTVTTPVVTTAHATALPSTSVTTAKPALAISGTLNHGTLRVRGGADAEDADDEPVYDNPTACQAHQPAAEGMEDNTRVLEVMAQLRRATPGVIRHMKMMADLLFHARSLSAHADEGEARSPSATPQPPMPLPPPHPMPQPPPPPTSYHLTLIQIVKNGYTSMELQMLKSFTYLSKACHAAFQSFLEERWAEALKQIIGYGEDPVGIHQRVNGFPISAFTTINNLPNARGVVKLLLPKNRHNLVDDIIRSWGVHNLVQEAYQPIPTKNLRTQAQDTLDKLVTQATGASSRLNVLVQGHTFLQLLQNGLRPMYLTKVGAAAFWDALGVTYNKDLTAPLMSSNLPDSSRLGGFVVQARIIAGAKRNPNAELPHCCPHSRWCVRLDSHSKKVCVEGRDVMMGGTTVGFIGFAAIGHLSGQKDYAIHQHLCPSTALAIKRLLLGEFQIEEIKVYI